MMPPKKMHLALAGLQVWVWMAWPVGAAHAVDMDWVPIGNPDNAADTPTNCYGPGCGSVGYTYAISKYEVTNAQYAEFLNAKGASDANSLFDANMTNDSRNGGITRIGSFGSYAYSVKAGFENKPVTYVSFWDALRFVNWLNNGQGTADTEDGAYTFTAEGVMNNTIARNPDASVFLPSENEWYKAAYYDPAASSYFAYPAGSSTPTACATPGSTANTANCDAAVGQAGQVSDVGAYTESASPYGTFDQGGNVYEWDEQIVSDTHRGIRGGSWEDPGSDLAASNLNYYDPDLEFGNFGFRVATLAPEPPGAGVLAMGVLLGMAARRTRA